MNGRVAFQQGLYRSANPTRRWLHNRRLDWVVRAIDEVWSQPKADSSVRSALEVGVGCGIITAHLAPRFRTLAVDIEPAFLGEARRLQVATALVDVCNQQALCSAVQAHSPDGVDLAICSEVLEHVESPAEALHALYSCLKPGGLLILTTPQRGSIAETAAGLLRFRVFRALARYAYREPVEELGHVSLMSIREVRSVASACGFTVLGHDVIGAYLPLVAEFLGRPGQFFLEKLEGAARRYEWFSALLWTQCWILIKAAETLDVQPARN